MNTSDNLVNVFWTGGMDSTFNLIHQLKTNNSLIQPHYIVRHEESTGLEISTMNSIRREVIKRFPEVHDRFLPTIYINEDFIMACKEVDNEIRDLRKTYKISEQYQIISRYCVQYKIKQIDISYEKDLHPLPAGRDLSHLFGESLAFKSITNPLSEHTKRDCYNIAKTEGWSDILDMTVFCRRPRRNSKPCGACGTCIDTVKAGMGFRLPIFKRIKAQALLPFREYWRSNYAKNQEKKLFKLIKQKYEGKW